MSTSESVKIDDPPEPARRSIWSRAVSAMLLTTIAVLAVLLAVDGYWTTRMQRELTQLRRDGGHLDVKDENKVYVRRMVTGDPYEWAWRIHVPANRAFKIHNWGGRMPGTGFPGDPQWAQMRGTSYGGGTSMMEAGEFLVRIKVHQQPDGQWIVSKTQKGNRSNTSLNARGNWLRDRKWLELSDIAGDEQQEFSADQPVTLLRLCDASGADDPKAVVDSALIWFDDTSGVRQ